MFRRQVAGCARSILIAAAVAGGFAAWQMPASFAKAPVSSVPAPEKTGFVNRVFQDAAGDHKYVLFIPQNFAAGRHAPGQRWPVILYLHGAGERGTDGRMQTSIGLGPFVKARAATFPFFVVFPQCEETHGRILTAWSGTSPDGKRALAILDSVEKEFPIDSRHRVLTGWSMGGYGTWNLGAADPSRWSALVPVSGGGEPAKASRLAKKPIWAFVGQDDNVVSPQKTRQMVDAVRAAGGDPLLTVVPGEGHDVWKTVYNEDRVFAWMLDPSKKPSSKSTSAAVVAGPARGGPSALSTHPGSRLKPQPQTEGPFVPAVAIPNAIAVRLGNNALKALAHSAAKLIPADALSGRINDIFSSTESSGYVFGVQFSNISYSGQVARTHIQAYAKDRLNIQLALANVQLVIGNTYVSGSGRSAVAGPISIVIGHRYPVWLSFDVTPYVDKGNLRFQVVATRFQIPNDDWYVTSPYGVGVSGLGMTEERVSSGLVQAIYGQKYRIEQETVGIIPTIVSKIEENFDLADVSHAANAFWPLPVYRPRLRVWPETVNVDDKGISLVMGVMAAAADPRKAPAKPRIEPSAGVSFDAVPRDSALRLGIAPSVMEQLTRMLIREDVAHINVLDIPDKTFAPFADRNVLAQILPDLAQVPKEAEISAELILASPIQVRDGQTGPSNSGEADSSRLAKEDHDAVRVTALKPDPGTLSAPSPSKSGRPGPRPFEFVVPRAVIAVAVKDGPEATQWKPYAQFEFALRQQAAATVLRRGFSERALRIDWAGEPTVKASAQFASGHKPKNSKINTDKLREVFLTAWKAWTQGGPASQAIVPDVDFGYSKLRLGGAQWSPPVLAVRFDEPGVKITNSSKIDLVYETKDIYSPWSQPYTLKPGKSHEFPIADPLLFRRKAGNDYIQMYTLPVGSHCEFRAAKSGGPPNLFRVRETTAAR